VTDAVRAQPRKPAGRWVNRLIPRSLTFRVIAFSTVWAIVALIVISTVISSFYRQAAERGFESLLSAHLFNLIGSVSATEDGTITGAPQLSDLRFAERESGWYWSVEPASDGLKGGVQSPSMTEPIPSPTAQEVPFDADFQRTYTTQGIAGELVQAIETEIELGDMKRVARFRVIGNLSELETEIAGFEANLYINLLIFGVGMIAINALAILLGLRPLQRVRNALAQVREGTAQRLGGRFPAEIEPLANETNALIENNRRIVERSRTQVGNLAHSLKTPLAVLINEGRTIGGDKGTLIADQAGAMQQQLEHYLQRARVAAQRDSVVYRTPTVAVVQRMVRVMAKLKPGISLTFAEPEAEILFAGEREDLEEIAGNLLENAMKWGKSAVRASLDANGEGDSETFRLIIEDDGPGIPEDRAREALKRGNRLDETKPGTGLGLAIVSDLVKEYGGGLSLDRSGMGGLKAVVELKRAL
jgi:signal transduction histidine kinase